jgi:hypothetical protein
MKYCPITWHTAALAVPPAPTSTSCTTHTPARKGRDSQLSTGSRERERKEGQGERSKVRGRFVFGGKDPRGEVRTHRLEFRRTAPLCQGSQCTCEGKEAVSREKEKEKQKTNQSGKGAARGTPHSCSSQEQSAKNENEMKTNQKKKRKKAVTSAHPRTRCEVMSRHAPGPGGGKERVPERGEAGSGVESQRKAEGEGHRGDVTRGKGTRYM